MNSWVKKTMNLEKHLLKYYGESRPIARWLKKEEILSEKEINRIFWYGLPQHAHRKIGDRLKIVSPNHDQKYAPGMDVIKAGRYVFTKEAFDAESNDDELVIKKLKKSAKAKKKKKKVATDTESSESS